jgi:hypothetical protein
MVKARRAVSDAPLGRAGHSNVYGRRAQIYRDNTASDVWADTAYRPAANLALLARRGLRPQFQRKKPRGKPMPAHIVRGNATRARVRSRVEHVFAAQKCRLGLVVHTVGMTRARVKIGLANLAYNFTRLAWLNGRTAPVRSRPDRPCTARQQQPPSFNASGTAVIVLQRPRSPLITAKTGYSRRPIGKASRIPLVYPRHAASCLMRHAPIFQNTVNRTLWCRRRIKMSPCASLI